MISFLEGTIEHSGDKYVVLNTGGIGYKVILSPRVLNTIANRKDKVKLHIHSQMNMREGTFDMYGFEKKSDLDLFHLLTTVSGIGPKGAQNILSSVEPAHLKLAVVNQDADYLKKVSTLSSKVIQRLILELKGKVDHLEGETAGIDLSQDGQATEALLVLGYTAAEAKEALKDTKAETLKDRVREALKILAKK
ncbi:MAG: Holliday junction branch migration protein RuvA [Candidatus Pacebacteria bacterium]|nr:Holliday junction branch migration protein RuvA [Candidatus Paceibacterota bacterium]